MDITFFGAARSVTGSCTLVESNGKRILIDCGLAQGDDEKSWGNTLPFDAKTIDALLLTHAHIDHSGKLPLLVKQGFKGKIHSTEATKALCSIMLVDSGHIQESEAEWKNRKNLRSGLKPIEPLYTIEDAKVTTEMFSGHSYNERFTLFDTIEVVFVDAGHMLGSSSIQLWLTEGDESKTVVFSGDIGNLDQPLINNPVCFTKADFVIMESTYGDRLHPKREYNTQKEATEAKSKELAEIIRVTFEKGGNVIIPTFAVGRTQELLYLLRNIITKGYLPEIPYLPVYLDSPLAIEATTIFSNHMEGYFDKEAMDLVKEGINPLLFSSLTTTTTAQESKELNFLKESSVIISSSGMCEAGRIRHHLKHNLWREESTIVFTGYQAKGTLGRSLIDGATHVTLFNERIEVKATVTKLQGLSGHADQNGLIRWLGCLEQAPVHIFVNHGDENVAPSFAQFLVSTLDLKAWAPSFGEKFNLLSTALPVAKEEGITQLLKQDLQEALYNLELSLSDLTTITNRMHTHTDQVNKRDEAQKLKEAIERLTTEIATLSQKWGSRSSS